MDIGEFETQSNILSVFMPFSRENENLTLEQKVERSRWLAAGFHSAGSMKTEKFTYYILHVGEGGHFQTRACIFVNGYADSYFVVDDHSMAYATEWMLADKRVNCLYDRKKHLKLFTDSDLEQLPAHLKTCLLVELDEEEECN